MDGRRLRISGLFVAGAAALAGCRTTSQPATHAGTTLPGGDSGSLVTRVFGGPKANLGPAAPPPAAAVAARQPGPGLKPETQVAMADTELESAFSEGRTSSERDGLLDHARQRYQKALAADPDNLPALLGVARMYAKTGERERAAAAYEQVLAKYADAQKAKKPPADMPRPHDIAQELAFVHGRAGDWKAATEVCQYALSLDPENRKAHKTLGLFLARAGRPDAALAELAKVMPEEEARYNLARALNDSGQPELGKQHLQVALQKNPTFEPAKHFLDWLNSPTPPADAPPPDPNPVLQAGNTEPQGN